MIKTTAQLRELLRDCHIQSSYEDVSGQRRRASVESLLVLLRSLGVDINDPGQADELLRERRRSRLGCGVEPVVIAWDGRLRPVALTLPPQVAGVMTYELELEDGGKVVAGRTNVEDLNAVLGPDDATYEFVTHRLPIRGRLPAGYHRLHIVVGGQTCHSLIISAPSKAFVRVDAENNRPERHWCPFLPLYALRTSHDWGAGDFTALSHLAQWTGRLGGSAVGTLPLLAASLDEPFEPSPYRPVSRQFWNEFYIDVEAVEELRQNPVAQQAVRSDEFRQRMDQLRSSKFVDYRETMKLKREVLALLANEFFESRPARFAEFEGHALENPELAHYARFRAAADRQKSDWRSWPSRIHGHLADDDLNPSDARYHAYAQWIADEQLASLEKSATAAGAGLYLDLPVGVDPGGFDVWRHPDLYIAGATTGSPPDPTFTRGQDWGLPPLHPEKIREDGYQHLRCILATSMRYARYLRIDHAMGWHRLYAIAGSLSADQGAYIRYHADEFYAVASLESHRHQCTLLAENMGTVPPAVGRSLERHGIGGMWVAPYELEASRRHGFNRPPALSVASLNTHDMPPLAAWWKGDDIADRQDLGLIEEREIAAEREDRQKATAMLTEYLRSTGALPLDEEDEEIPVAALLRSIAASPAQLVLVGLEDLWFEERPQNVPGTSTERPNWRRKARHSLEEFTRMPEVLDALDQINALRHKNEKPR
jgi:4-alpha-glucanotransferase